MIDELLITSLFGMDSKEVKELVNIPNTFKRRRINENEDDYGYIKKKSKLDETIIEPIKSTSTIDEVKKWYGASLYLFFKIIF